MVPLACSVQLRLKRLLAIRAHIIDAAPVVSRAGRFLKVFEWSREGALLLVLNLNPVQAMGASVEVSPELIGKKIVRVGLAEARIVGEDGAVAVEAPPMSYAIYVTENLVAGEPLLRREELVSSSRSLRPLTPARFEPSHEVPLGWVQAILGAA